MQELWPLPATYYGLRMPRRRRRCFRPTYFKLSSCYQWGMDLGDRPALWIAVSQQPFSLRTPLHQICLDFHQRRSCSLVARLLHPLPKDLPVKTGIKFHSLPYITLLFGQISYLFGDRERACLQHIRVYNIKSVLWALWLWLLIFKARLLKFKNTLFSLKHLALRIEICGSQYQRLYNRFTKGYLRAQKAREGPFVLSVWSLPLGQRMEKAQLWLKLWGGEERGLKGWKRLEV